MAARYITIRMTRDEAETWGVLRCGTCGYPSHNHWGHIGGCAHDSRCKKYVETTRVGTIVRRKKVKR